MNDGLFNSSSCREGPRFPAAAGISLLCLHTLMSKCVLGVSRSEMTVPDNQRAEAKQGLLTLMSAYP